MFWLFPLLSVHWFSFSGGIEALPPLEPSLGVEEAKRFLEIQSSKKYECDISRLSTLPSIAEFAETWQEKPFILSAEALKMPPLQRNAVRSARPVGAEARVVLYVP
eukprot:gnl/MRDRNA2_/MRDRNA2_16341_c0_seq1.p3 gnl/MRDRNA2_/MRDRNA2_16341_c0~~gnl/MRDRNA2_/MRDRNA2_16341_c0_seq1.p3  ORF type:complete len:106 (-),score=16.11 gnl/MRDRNA2_/MRDRNA2_16341_c0_seq1:50-367(-)